MDEAEVYDDDGGDSGVGDLVSFLSNWREEIRYRSHPSVDHYVPNLRAASLGKRGSTSNEDVEDDVASSQPDSKRPFTPRCQSEGEPAPLLVLPAVERRGNTVALAGAGGGGRVDKKIKPLKKEDSLLDTLISDLNEINTIPFFDVQLPREIALLIFKYLDRKDLCNCSQVSKPWRSLAEDNLLWCQICHEMGYTIDDSRLDVINWKEVVKNLILQRRQVERNWKERICGLSDHQPDSSGVLCCVDCHKDTILMCYSSGAVYVWDLTEDSGPVLVKRILGPYSSSLPTCCSLTSGWGALGTSDGSLNIIDTDTCSQVFSLSDLCTVDSVSISNTDTMLAVGVSSHRVSQFNDVIQSSVAMLVAKEDNNTWERIVLPLLPEHGSHQISNIRLIPLTGNTQSPLAVLCSTSTSLTLYPLHTVTPTPLLTSAGERGATCVTCCDFNEHTIACGTSANGYQVQLFDLSTGAFKCSLRGHGQQVSCLSFPRSSECASTSSCLVTGSADKRVRVFDYRSPSLSRGGQPALILAGHGSGVRSVKMDLWKVVSGSLDGTMIVWDQRMQGELWRSHERHPVDKCHFTDTFLTVAHIPTDKLPPPHSGTNPHICHRRQRGLVRVYDFSVDPLRYTRMLPSICSSAYDEPSASFYNLDLKYPYDHIT